MAITMKMRVDEAKTTGTDVDNGMESLRLSAVVGEEGDNVDWSKWTPSAQLSATISNPAAMGKFPVGAIVYVTIEARDLESLPPAEDEPVEEAASGDD